MITPNDFDDEHTNDDLCEEDEYDPGEECGRWRNGRLASLAECLMAGTEFCDFECPYRR